MRFLLTVKREFTHARLIRNVTPTPGPGCDRTHPHQAILEATADNPPVGSLREAGS